MILPLFRSIDISSGRIWRGSGLTGWTPVILVAWGTAVGLYTFWIAWRVWEGGTA